MIILKSPGIGQDAGALLNFHIAAGRRLIVLDGSDGPFDILTPVEVKSDVTLTSAFRIPEIAGVKDSVMFRREFPPIVRRNPSIRQMFCLNGQNISVSGLMVDFNMDNGWMRWSRPFSFNTPGSIVGQPIGNIKLEHLVFFDSRDAWLNRTSPNDAWSIALTHDRAEPLDGFVVRNCINASAGFQLVSGGAGIGTKNVLIEKNLITRGRANSIAISMRFGSTTDEDGDPIDPDDDDIDTPNTHENVTVRYNRIYESHSSGVFVGQDANVAGKIVNLKNIFIHDNEIRMGQRTKPAAKSVLIKIGTDPVSVGENIRIFNNIMDATKNTNSPRWIAANAPTGNTKSEIFYWNNTFIGSAVNSISENFTVNSQLPPVGSL
jgi:hypothetical protein